tara:strand:+ start:1535 stop:2056 length:522 start_codon:yes stop_codon:yes gene_type:complete
LTTGEIGELIGLVAIAVTVFLFIAFPTLAFIYSMIFARYHQGKSQKQLLARESFVMEQLGEDNLHTLSNPITGRKINESRLLVANITVGPSWWQLFLGEIRSIFGGNIVSFDKVLAYGRSEVMQRLREQAIGEGWDEVLNVRVETSMVMNKVSGGKMNKRGTLEFLAYGTGIR